MNVAPDTLERVGEPGGVLCPLAWDDHELGTADERQIQVGDRQVEGGRGDVHDHVLVRQAGSLAHRHEQVDDRPVTDLDALGSSRRPRRVDDIGEAVGIRGVGWRRRRRGGDFVPIAVQADDVGCMLGQDTQERFLRDDHRHRGVGEHERLTVTRVRRLDGHVGRPRLEDAECRNQGLRDTVEADTDQAAGGDAEPAQVVREAIRALVELAIGERAARALDRRPVGSHRRLCRDRLVHALPVDDPLSAVPLVQEEPLLGVRQEREHPHRQTWIGGGPVEQVREVPDEAVDGLGLEEIGRVLDDHVEAAVLALVCPDGEVEARPRPDRQGHRLHGHAAELERRRCEVVREQHLEDRRMTGVAVRIERFDEPLEGQLLVCKGIEGRRSDPLQQFSERELLLDGRAESERVGEVPDQRLCLLVVPPADRCPDDDVFDSGVAVEQRVEAGEQHRVEGDVVAASERAQAFRQLSRQSRSPLGAVVGLRGRTRLVERKVEPVGRVRKPKAPMGDQLVQPGSRNLLALPRGVIGVLNR